MSEKNSTANPPEKPDKASESETKEVNVETPKKKVKPEKIDVAEEFKLPVHQIDATKKRVHPRFAKGKYQSMRLISMYAIFAMFFILPWISYNGRQALWFNMPDAKIYLFGLTLLPQDMYYLAFFFIIAAYSLFAVTVYAGRVWCGYACPQTIWTHLFQHVEKWIIGERNKRIKFDKQPMSAKKAMKKGLIYLIWLIISFATALTFVSYVFGTEALYFNWTTFSGIPIPDWPNLLLLFLGIFTFATYANAGYMREHMCIHICPYGRFQSVMFDKDTLVVSYDYHRGEPRGARKKGTKPDNLGECIGCSMCVQVCPTGIDIRDGLQVECIQCAACVDACNDIMDKVGYPRGLVRYTTDRQLVDKENTRVISPRIFAYVIILAVLISGVVYTIFGRVPLDININRSRQQLTSMTFDGMIQNSYVVKITNKTQDKNSYIIKLEPQDGLTLKSRFKEIPLRPSESFKMPTTIQGDPKVVADGSTPIQITVTSKDGKYTASRENTFVK